MSPERAAQQFEVGHQLGRTEVVDTGFVLAGGGRGQAGAGTGQLGPDARDLQPVRFLGVDATEPRIDLGKALEVLGEGREQLIGHTTDARRDTELLDQRLQRSLHHPDPQLVLQPQRLHGHLRRDAGIAVPIAAGPRPEAQRDGIDGEVHVEAGEHGSQIIEHRRNGVERCVLDVEHDVARLVDRIRALPPQLVGQPQQVDDLGQLAVRALDNVQAGEAGRFSGLFVEDGGHRPELGQRRTPRRFGGVGGEHRPHVELSADPFELGRGHASLGDRPGGALQPAAVSGAPPPQLPPTVNLLDDVGQVEVGGERSDEPDRVMGIDGAQEGVGRGLVAAEGPDLLDEIEEPAALLPDETLAEKRRHSTYVRAQRRVSVAILPAHRARIASRVARRCPVARHVRPREFWYLRCGRRRWSGVSRRIRRVIGASR